MTIRLIRSLSLVIGTCLTAASPALASFYSIASDTRSVSAAVSVTNNTSTESFGPDTRSRPGLGLDWNSNNSASAVRSVIGAGAASGASQTSTFASNGVITFLGSVSGSANTTNGGLAATADASTIVDLLFDIPVGTRVRVQASRSGTGVVRLTDELGTQTFFNGSGFFDQTFAATRLRFFASATSTISIGPETTGNDGGGFSVLLTIPAPGASSLLAGSVLLLLRRSRRSQRAASGASSRAG